MRYAQQHGVLCAHAELRNRHFQRRFTQAALSLGAAKRWIAAGKTGGAPLPTQRGTSPENPADFQGRLNIVRLPNRSRKSGSDKEKTRAACATRVRV